MGKSTGKPFQCSHNFAYLNSEGPRVHAQVQKQREPMSDVTSWIALAIAWFSSWVYDQPRQVLQAECNCNCTCEVTTDHCPQGSTFFGELFKIFLYLAFGIFIGAGYVLKGLVLGVRALRHWICSSPTASSPTSWSSPLASLSVEPRDGQRDLALQQLELVRRRRASRSWWPWPRARGFTWPMTFRVRSSSTSATS